MKTGTAILIVGGVALGGGILYLASKANDAYASFEVVRPATSWLGKAFEEARGITGNAKEIAGNVNSIKNIVSDFSSLWSDKRDPAKDSWDFFGALGL